MMKDLKRSLKKFKNLFKKFFKFLSFKKVNFKVRFFNDLYCFFIRKNKLKIFSTSL